MSEEPWLRVLEDAVVVRVRVVPKSSRTRIDGVVGGRLKVRVTAPPVEGAANEAVVEALAKAAGVAKRDVAVETGATSRSKTLRISSGRPELLAERLGAAAIGSR